MLENKSKVCLAFVDGIAHPNEKVLAEEILQGKKVGEFSLDFDQGQMDAMTERLKGAGCFDPVEPEEPAGEEPKEDDEPNDEDENADDAGEDTDNADGEEAGETDPDPQADENAENDDQDDEAEDENKPKTDPEEGQNPPARPEGQA